MYHTQKEEWAINPLSCAFTGHRWKSFSFTHEKDPRCQKIKTAMLSLIEELYLKGIRRFYVGCAMAADTWAAESVLQFKEQGNRDTELFCAIPFIGYDDNWPQSQKERMRRIIAESAEKKIIYKDNVPQAYRARNYFMVDNSQYLIAVYNPAGGGQRSGTSMTVNYALKNKLCIYYIHPETAEVTRRFPE